MTAALTWTYDDRACIPTFRATYRGVTIRAEQDSSPENPWEAWDCEPPTLVYAGRSEGFSDYSGGELERPLQAMTDGAVSRHWRAIAKALGVTESDHESEVKAALADGYTVRTQIRRDLFDTALNDSRWNDSGTDYLETLATLWRLAGCAAQTWVSRGYSQGDWAEGLSVATPEWAAKVGAPRASHERQMKAAGRLWGAWAWGNVYGYVIEEGEESCWGYYGDDFEESGLAEAARDAVDSMLDSRRRRRQARAAELIRARVPLDLRPALLDAATVAA